MKTSRFVVVCAILLALFLLAIVATPNLLRSRSAAEKAVEDAKLPQQSGSYDSINLAHTSVSGFVAGVPDGETRSPERMIIQKASLVLVVASVRTAAERIEALAQAAGGYLESSNISQMGDGSENASLTIRAPASKSPGLRNAIKGLALHVESESTEAQDVTREFVDNDSRLRNLRAAETQYLEIMKRAGSIKDTVEVARQLDQVRSEIEQLQGQQNYLSHQVQMAALVVQLRPESQKGPEPGAINWRPLLQARNAFHDMLRGLAEYADTMIAFFLLLPVMLVWLATWALGLLLAWRVLKWLWRLFRGRTGAS